MNKKQRYLTIGRREFLRNGSLAAISLPLLAGGRISFPENGYTEKVQQVKPEWRNKQ
jgi:hypothetical protein